MSTWTFRPSVISLPGYREAHKEAKLSRGTFLEQYQKDNDRATRPTTATIPPRSSAKFRTLQWNLNGWHGDSGTLNASAYAKQIEATILQADADCIILNEYHWDDKERVHLQFEHTLRGLGYTTQLCGTVCCPTFVATRWHVTNKIELILSEERSALVLKLMDVEGQDLTVIGTHLDFQDGQQRYQEMQTLIQELVFQEQTSGNPQEHDDCCDSENSNDFAIRDTTKVIIAGDLNQQRERDYSAEEWKSVIVPNMMQRQACLDDGVDKLLQSEGFRCAWDEQQPSASGGSKKKNWATAQPPSTHWSGTIVDYSYGRNVRASAVFISPAGWSDHRMTVADWNW